MKISSLLLLTIGLLHTSYGQSVSVSGEVARPLTFKVDALKALPHTTVTGKDHDGKLHQYSGIPIIELLKLSGVTSGEALRGKNLLNYVIVRAIDGYEAVFALPELDPEFATRTIILADAIDDVPLTAVTGPYRVVVPDEKKQARWVRLVNAIEVRVAR